MRRPIAFAATALCAAVLAHGQAAGLRDPTQPPPGHAASPGVQRPDPLAGLRLQHLVVIDGERYVVWQGRRHRVGDRLLGLPIERIEETQVWLRGAGGLRKLPLYTGIERRAPRNGGRATAPDEQRETPK